MTNVALKQTDLHSFDLIWLHMAWAIFSSQNPRSSKDFGVRKHGPKKEGVGLISSRTFMNLNIFKPLKWVTSSLVHPKPSCCRDLIHSREDLHNTAHARLCDTAATQDLTIGSSEPCPIAFQLVGSAIGSPNKSWSWFNLLKWLQQMKVGTCFQ